jgi:exosortase K
LSTRRWPLILFALAFAYALKRYYSHAEADSLKWMLAPTAWLVGALYRAPFSFVSGYGYFSPELRFAIVPACAGINFLVMAVGAFACGILPQVERLAVRLRWLVLGAAAAYVVTLLANTVRIAIAVWLELHPVSLDHAQLHRIEGSLVYLVFLFGFYSIAQAQVRRHAA